MKIYLATDHAGFNLKEEIKKYLTSKQIEFEDEGAFELNQNDDYPDLIAKASENVSKDSSCYGIIFGKSGAGEAIVANKFKNIRAVIGFSEENVKLAREHNNANVLSLGSDFVTIEQAKKFIDIFLETPFSMDERHKRRLDKISLIEEKNE
jgi:ribose 5-phosphate isomerase B